MSRTLEQLGRLDGSVLRELEKRLGAQRGPTAEMAHALVVAELEARIEKAATKHEQGQDFPAAAYAYVPDAEKPSTWKLRLWEDTSKKETARQVGMAVAALGAGFRGQKVQIPSDDLAAVKRKVLAAWRKVNPDKKPEDEPRVLKRLTFMEESRRIRANQRKPEAQTTHSFRPASWSRRDGVRRCLVCGGPEPDRGKECGGLRGAKALRSLKVLGAVASMLMEGDVVKRIVEDEDGKFCVVSQDGAREFGCYDTHEQAMTRMHEVEQFKKPKTASTYTQNTSTVTTTLGAQTSFTYSVQKANEELHYTLGPVYSPQQTDAHGEFTDAENLRKAAWDFVRASGTERTINLQHTGQRAGEWVEIVQWPEAVNASLRQPDGTVKSVSLPAGTIYLGVVWDEGPWTMLKEGKIGGFSMGGRARREVAVETPYG